MVDEGVLYVPINDRDLIDSALLPGVLSEMSLLPPDPPVTPTHVYV